MISSVYSSSKWVTAHSSPGMVPYINPTQPMSGMVRFYNNQMQVYDGSSWLGVGGGTASVSMAPDAEQALEWALKQLREEQHYAALALKHPAIADALEALNEMKNRMKVIVALVEENNNA